MGTAGEQEKEEESHFQRWRSREGPQQGWERAKQTMAGSEEGGAEGEEEEKGGEREPLPTFPAPSLLLSSLHKYL